MKNEKLLRIFQNNNFLYEEVVEMLCKYYENQGVFIDCGAHTGQHSVNMLLNDNCIEFIGVEAIPSLCEIAENNIATFNKNKKIINIALGNIVGEVIFSVANDAMGYSGIIRRENIPVNDWKQIKVNLTKLDDLMSNKINISLVKLDLEGGEFHALLGAKNILHNSEPFIIFENSLKESAKIYNYSKEEFFLFFNEIDYILIDFFGNVVDFNYWDAVLQTYMFCGLPRKSLADNNKINFINQMVQKVIIKNNF